jgi:RNA polymerase sigma factor (sigma-70 family)
MDPESSRELIRRAQAGETEALNDLLARYLPRLRHWASRRLPSHARDLGDTDDLVQKALMRTLNNLSTFVYRADGSFYAYLRQAVMNQLRDELRRAGRRPEHKDLAESAPDASVSPLDAAIGREAVERYERALEQLSEADQEAVILRVEFGFSFQEIADAVGKPSADAARMAVGRALETLAALMAERERVP